MVVYFCNLIIFLGRWNTLIQRDPDFDEYNDIVNEHCKTYWYKY